MALTGTFEADGRRWTFRKPHVGPVMRFNELLSLAQEGRATLAQMYGGIADIIVDAVKRVDPSVTKEALLECLDEDDLKAFQAAIMELSRPKGADSGEP